MSDSPTTQAAVSSGHRAARDGRTRPTCLTESMKYDATLLWQFHTQVCGGCNGAAGCHGVHCVEAARCHVVHFAEPGAAVRHQVRPVARSEFSIAV